MAAGVSEETITVELVPPSEQPLGGAMLERTLTLVLTSAEEALNVYDGEILF